MLKYNEILQKLSAKQKIALITDIGTLADPEYAEAGIPGIRIASLDEIFAMDSDDISPSLLARCWDGDLISSLTEKILKYKGKNANVILAPAPKIDFGSAGGTVLSEDPLLASRTTQAYIKAIRNAGKSAIIPDFYLRATEIMGLDKVKDPAVIREFLIKPFSEAVLKGGAKAVICSVTKNKGSYETLNIELIRNKDKYFPKATFMLCECNSYDDTLLALEEDCIVMRGIGIAVENAYDQYLTLKGAVEKGQVSMIALEEAFAHRIAMSDEMLDAAADRVIDFAFALSNSEFDCSTNIIEPVADTGVKAPAAEPKAEDKPAADDSEPTAEPKAEDEPTPVEDSEPVAEPKAEDKPAAEDSEPVAEPKAEDEPAAEDSEPVAELKAEDEPAAEDSEPAAEPKAEDEPAAEDSEPAAEPKAEDKPAAEDSEPTAEPKAEDKPAADDSEPVAEPKAEDEPAAEDSEPAAEPKAEDEPATEDSEPVAEPKAEDTAPDEVEANTPVEEEEFDLAGYEKLKSNIIEKSIVILKNDNNVLSFKKGTKYAIIGDAAIVKEKEKSRSFAEYFANSHPNGFVGAARGYSLSEDRSDGLISYAVSVAKKASVAFVFLKAKNERHRSYNAFDLPANQIALLEALSETNTRVVAVLSSERAVSVKFDKYVNALILAPIGKKASAQALAKIVFDKNPAGGRLTTTYYDDPEMFFAERRFYKNSDRNKVGPFIGYRLYDSENSKVGYPFGWGLSYSNVKYSNITASGGGITFTVTNSSSLPIDEVVQIYSGKSDSKVIRPKKALNDYFRLHLKPGESRSVNIKNLKFPIYDVKEGKYVTEHGKHSVYVGSSVSSVKFVASVSATGVSFFGDAPSPADYLQSESNIISKEFVLEASHKKMSNKGLKIWGFTLLALAAIIAVFSLLSSGGWVPLVPAGILALVSLILLIKSSIVKKKMAKSAAAIEEKNKQLFEGAEEITDKGLDELFVKEFDKAFDEGYVKEDNKEEFYGVDTSTKINADMTFAVASADIRKFYNERGISVTEDAAAAVVASLAASRLVFLRSAHGESVSTFVSGIAEYLNAKLYTETVTERHLPKDKLLMVTNDDGTTEPTSVLSAITAAVSDPENMYIVYLKGIEPDKVADNLTPYVKFFGNPATGAEIAPKGSDTIYTVPANVWFFAELAEGSAVETIPSYILECSVIYPVRYGESEVAEEPSVFVPITAADIGHLAPIARKNLALHEDVWKKIDSLEAFAAKHASYTIGNKFWIQIEYYLSVLTRAGVETDVAIDRVLTSSLLPALVSALEGKIADNEKGIINEVERLFGEDTVPLCRELFAHIS